MPFRSLYVFNDGILAFSEQRKELEHPERMRMRYAHTQRALEEILFELREQSAAGLGLPGWAPVAESISLVEFQIEIAKKIPPTLKDVDYVGEGAYALFRWLYLVYKHTENKSGITPIPTDVEPDKFGVLFAPVIDVAVTIAAVTCKEGDVASLFFSRSQGFNFLKEIPWLPTEEVSKAKKQVRTMRLPERANGERVDIVGEAARMIYNCLREVIQRWLIRERGLH